MNSANNVVLTSVDSRGIATVTLNRPERGNAYNSEVIISLLDAMEEISGDESVRLLVIRGNGRHFQAGADLEWVKEIGELDYEENFRVSTRTANAIQGLLEFPKPTIALIHGGCFGGGTGLAAAADIVIASEDAIFSITEARWGVMAGIIIPHLNAAIGVRHVRRYALTCEKFGAHEAVEIGLVHKVCEQGSLDETAEPMIDLLLKAAPGALAKTKRRALEESNLLLSDEKRKELISEHAEARTLAEAAEGLASFLEKRNPEWYPTS